jgi:DNA-binding CsgD family transcriptional regulator
LGHLDRLGRLRCEGRQDWLRTRRGLFDNLQTISDYLVFFATIIAGLYIRSRTAVLVGREAAKAMIALGGFAASIFLVLGLWWVVGDSVSHVAPALGPAFLLLMFLAFNIGLATWLIRFSGILAGPETMRFVARKIPGSLFAQWGISRREGEIIELVGQGLSNQDIADRLFISLFTVKKHLSTVFQKTGVENRVKLVRLFAGSEPGPAAGSEEARPIGAHEE